MALCVIQRNNASTEQDLCRSTSKANRIRFGLALDGMDLSFLNNFRDSGIALDCLLEMLQIASDVTCPKLVENTNEDPNYITPEVKLSLKKK